MSCLPSLGRIPCAGLLTLLAALTAGAAGGALPEKNHSFQIELSGATICRDGATFDGVTTAASSLDLLMTSQVFDALGTTLLATGDTHTFTSIGESYTFVVSYPAGTFNVGDAVGLSVADVPGTLFDDEGDFDNSARVADCLLAEVPALPSWGPGLLALLLAGGGALFAARGRRQETGGGGPSAGRAVALALVALGAAGAARAQPALPSFSKAFAPATIGPGSTSHLTLTIVNNGGSLATDLAFTDTLPAGMSLADPAAAVTDCSDAILSAPAGGSVIELSNGRLGAGKTCSVKADVVGTATATNITGDLTSSLGNSGPAEAVLTVSSALPGFSKTFVPSTIPVGGVSTLVLTIDNSAGADLFDLSFTDVFPAGLRIAAPSYATSDCGSYSLTAVSGTALVSFLGSGLPPSTPVLAEGATCTVSLEVTTDTSGIFVNTSSNLLVGGAQIPAGFASATLGVPVEFLSKSFIDDPVPPGGTVTLRFTILNTDRSFPATDIAFDDTLDPMDGLTGLAPSGALPTDPCGAGSLLTFSGGVLSLAGGSLPADGGSCTFDVALDVPASATAGKYTNTTTVATATIDGAAEPKNAATDELTVRAVPVFTKEFIGDPVTGGDSVTLRFTIHNTDPSSTLSAIGFTDDLNLALFGLAANGLVAGAVPDPLVDPCGTGSQLTVYDPAVLPADPTMLIFEGGTLAPAGSLGDSCTFDVVLDVPGGTVGGVHLNTTSDIHGTLASGPVIGAGASGELTVVAAPRLTKEFLDDPVAPGAQVTLQFTLARGEEAVGDASAITFTDDLSTVLTGLAAAAGELPLADVCGSGNGTLTGSAGDTLLTFAGATLAPGDTCAFSVLLDVPGGAPGGSFLNESSGVGATVAGLPVVSPKAKDTLTVAQLAFAKAFTDDPVLPGGMVTLEFTLTNLAAAAASAIAFDDLLDPQVLPGLGISSLPADGFCGGGSHIAGFDPVDPFPSGPPNVLGLRMTGGSLAAAGSAGDSCTFDVTLSVPGGAADGDYVNVTQALSATIGATPVLLPPASDVLTVVSELLTLSKAFLDDPVAPGGTVTLRFTLVNLDPDDPITGIAFSDDLDAALSGLAAAGLPFSACGGTASTADGGATIDFTGGSLAAGASCSFDVTVDVPAGLPAGPVINTTSEVIGVLDGLPVLGAPASDGLDVRELLFTKAFDGPTTAGGSPTLTFTIHNLNAGSSATALAFTDDLDATLSGLAAVGLPLAAPCGAASQIAGASFLTFNGGSLPPGGTCSFDVTLQVPAGAAAGTYPNTTSDLTSSGLSVAVAAAADLMVEPAPTFAKVFAPATIGVGFDSVLTFTIDNTASALPASGLAFTDVLPFGLLVSAAPAVVNGCGGTVTAVPSSTSIGLGGGSVAAGASCTLAVRVTATGLGALVNTTGDLTSSSGNSGTATAALGVASCLAADGTFLTLGSDVVLVPESYEVCHTLSVEQHYLVLGPSGDLTLRAGVAVVIFSGVEIGSGGRLAVEIDPSLVP